MPNFAEEEMEKWHKENNEPISQSDRSFYKSFGDQYLDDERRIRDQQRAEGAKEEAEDSHLTDSGGLPRLAGELRDGRAKS